MGPGRAQLEEETWAHPPPGPPPAGGTEEDGCIVCRVAARSGDPGGLILGYQDWHSSNIVTKTQVIWTKASARLSYFSVQKSSHQNLK